MGNVSMLASCCCLAAVTLPTCMTWHSTLGWDQLPDLRVCARCLAVQECACICHALSCKADASHARCPRSPHALLLHSMTIAPGAGESRALRPDPDAARCRRARSTDGAHLLAGQHLGPSIDKQRRSIDGMEAMQRVLKNLRRSVEMRVGHVGSWLGWLCNVCLSANLRRGPMTLLMTPKTLPAHLQSFLQDIVLGEQSVLRT